MQKNKRMRVFAGPNGSGKSTLFKEFLKKYDAGYFINADEIEKSLSLNGFIDLSKGKNELGKMSDELSRILRD